MMQALRHLGSPLHSQSLLSSGQTARQYKVQFCSKVFAIVAMSSRDQ